MGGASLGCPLAEEEAVEEAEEEGAVPLSALSLGASGGQREAVPQRVCAGEAWGPAWLVVWSLGYLGERMRAVSSPPGPGVGLYSAELAAPGPRGGV